MSWRQVYDARKAAGLCVRCARPAEPGRTRCKDCKAYTRDWVQARYDKLALRGLCVRCGRRPVGRLRVCMPCRKRDAAKRRERYDEVRRAA